MPKKSADQEHTVLHQNLPLIEVAEPWLLDTILAEMSKGDFSFKRALEDIHMNVESRLAELIGPAAGRLLV
jgi:hypothetical protein